MPKHIAITPYILEDYHINDGDVHIVKPADPELVKQWHESREYFQEQRRIKAYKKAFKVKRK